MIIGRLFSVFETFCLGFICFVIGACATVEVSDISEGRDGLAGGDSGVSARPMEVTNRSGGKGVIARGVKPNIILFVVDDMGWQDTSVSFGKKRTVWNNIYHTPHMETLASRGMKFTNAYASHPVCSPTRMSFMTGQNPARSGVSDWIGHGRSKNRYLFSPEWRSVGLQPGDGFVTLPTLLRGAGYRTIHIGKAHFGQKLGADPTNLGFDINIAGSHGGGPWGGWYSPWLGKYAKMYPGLEDRPEGEYLTDAITIKARGVIRDAAAEGVPFFMNMAQFAVHTQIAAGPEKYLKFYRDGRPKVESDYGSMLTGMDASLGAILSTLRDPNGDGNTADSIAENTIILFVSDNGGLSNHARSNAGKALLNSGIRVRYKRDYHNAPALSGKGSGYDGGTRIPMIVAWAGQLKKQKPINSRLSIVPGTTCAEPVHGDDIFPTILSIAGVKNPLLKIQRDGQDLGSLLRRKSFTRKKPLFWHYPHQWYRDVGVGAGIEPYSAMRKGDWKLIYFYGDGVSDEKGYDPRTELYHVSVDVGEKHNLASKKPKLAIKLRRELFRWLDAADAGLPIVRATGKRVDIPTAKTPFK